MERHIIDLHQDVVSIVRKFNNTFSFLTILIHFAYIRTFDATRTMDKRSWLRNGRSKAYAIRLILRQQIRVA